MHASPAITVGSPSKHGGNAITGPPPRSLGSPSKHVGNALAFPPPRPVIYTPYQDGKALTTITAASQSERAYKASGILIFTRIKDELHVLFFKEKRTEGTFWIDIGGKRAPIDHSSWETAYREFEEEMPNLCSIRESDIIKSIWIPVPGYVLYCLYKNVDEVFINTQVRWFPLKKVLKRPSRLCNISVHARLDRALDVLVPA